MNVSLKRKFLSKGDEQMNLKKLRYVFIIPALGILFASCSSSSSSSAPVSVTPVVYVAGSYSNGGDRIATVWEDGVANDLDCPVGASCSASSVYVSDGHVYVAGNYTTGGNSFAVVWIDGVMKDISVSTTYNYATSISVSGGVVYVTGFYSDDGGVNIIPAMWIDSGSGFVETDLQTTSVPAQAYANSIFVSGGTFYAGGFDGNFGAIWTNIGEVTLAGNSYPSVNSIYASGGDVYAAGFDFDGTISFGVATVWKNGVKLPDLSVPIPGTIAQANSIFVDSGSVYVAGTYGSTNTVAASWVDGVRTDLPVPPLGVSTAGSSIFVSGGSVYVAGSYNDGVNDIAVIWTDAGTGFVATDLVNPGTSSTATSVFVAVP
jgi:hypothetical protein